MRKINLPKTIWLEMYSAKLIDQTKIPLEGDKLDPTILEVKTHEEMAGCIRDMKIRGAPAIGGAVAAGMMLAAFQYRGSNGIEFLNYLNESARRLNVRPTARNLTWALEEILGGITAKNVEGIRKQIASKVKRILEEDEKVNRKIGEIGSKLIKDDYAILTHCNAGSLATVYYGTALAPIYYSWEQGKNLHVIVDETRPRLQGANLTAWELKFVGIPYTLITDNMAAAYMKRNGVDLVVVGADRIANNGDVANKIGTYSLAIVAEEHDVPFYVAAPTSTIDVKTESGKDIEIEERDSKEVLYIKGNLIGPKDSKVWNPAFDITPAKYIKGIITERGIIRPSEVKKLIK